jgi:hypothetical protein
VSSSFGSDDDLFLAHFLEAGNQALAAAVSIDIRGVDEVDAGIDGLVESRD